MRPCVLVDELRDANAVLVKRVAELEARSGANPRNSSRPPPSERYAKPRRKRSVRRDPGVGGSLVRRGRIWRRSSILMRSWFHILRSCSGCGGDLSNAAVTGTEVHQVFDVPPMRVAVTEHRGQRRRRGCGVSTAAVFPAEARAAACYGCCPPRSMSMAASRWVST